MSARLDELRADLERMSLRILGALNQRARRALDVAGEKRRLGLPARDAHREAALIEHLVAENEGPFDERAVRSLFRAVLDATVTLMEERGGRGLRVAAAGGPAISVRVRGRTLGGLGSTPSYIAGPCSVESEEQIEELARRLAALGVGFLRGGCYKPRTSPYAFQGLGAAGLALLQRAAARHGLATITEATGADNVDRVAEHADVIQIGARNMYNYDLLRAAGRTGKPVLLKRGLSATLDEWLHAAEYVALAGSEQIVLCERGIRTFARETRGTLDLSIVPLARAASRLPVIVDVSHAAGRRDILAPLARAAFAAGAEAVMIEVHTDPDAALSDGEQQLSIDDFAALQREVAASLDRLSRALAPVAGDAAVLPFPGSAPRATSARKGS